MDMSGEYKIAAPRQTVWAGLNDPDVLKACIPGCETLEKISDTELTAKVKAKVGPVSASFSGKVTLSDIDPPNGYRISGEGTGGAAGFAKGGATVALAEEGPGTTILTYTAEAQVGGKLAQIGSRLIQGTAKKMADDFFARFSEAMGSEATGGVAPVAVGVDGQGAAAYGLDTPGPAGQGAMAPDADGIRGEAVSAAAVAAGSPAFSSAAAPPPRATGPHPAITAANEGRPAGGIPQIGWIAAVAAAVIVALLLLL